MKVKRALIYLCLAIIFSLSLFALSGCLPLKNANNPNNKDGYKLYFTTNSSLVTDDNDTIELEYKTFTKIEDYISLKYLKKGEETIITEYQSYCSSPLNETLAPGTHSVTIIYEDFEETFYICVTYPDSYFEVEQSYTYGEYELPSVSEENVTYTLYYSTHASFYGKKLWKDNKTIDTGEYFVWAEVSRRTDNATYNTSFRNITINPKIIQKPTVTNKTYTYTGETQTVEIENYDTSVAIYAGNFTATMPSTYSITVTPYKNYAWQDGTTNTITINWTIDKLKLEMPSVVGEYYYDNYKTISVSLTPYNHDLISVAGRTFAREEGTYSILVEIKNPLIYEFTDGTTEKSLTWQIKKRIQPAPTDTIQLKIKKASHLSILSDFLPKNYYLYNESTLPFTDNIDWIFQYDYTTSINAEKYYKSSSTDELYWVKKEVYQNGELSSTRFYQAGRFKDQVGTQEVYLTYNEDTENFAGYPLVATVNLEQKSTGSIELKVESVAFIEKSENNYSIIYNENTNKVSAVSDQTNYKIYYKNLSDNQINETGIINAGNYEIWAEIPETEDLYYVKTPSIFVEIEKATVSKINNLATTQIEYLSTLQDCVISGYGYSNTVGSIQGTFAFDNATTIPTVSDSNVTEFDFTFTPDDQNIEVYHGKTKIVINKGKLTYLTPTLNNHFKMKQGTWLSEIPVGTDGKATNKLGEEILGVWELTSSSGYLHDYAEFIFTPFDANYETATVKDNNSNNNISVFDKFTITTEPTLKVAYQVDGEYYTYIQGGKAQLRYKNTVEYLNLDFDDATFRVAEGTYNLVYYFCFAGEEYSCGTISKVTPISSMADFQSAITSTKQEIFLLNTNISLDENLVATAKKIIIIPSLYSLKLNSYTIDFTDTALESAIINHGEVVATNINETALANVNTIYNYGDMSLAKVSSPSQVTIKNFGNFEIKLLQNKISGKNFASLTILSTSGGPIVAVDNLSKSSSISITASEAFSLDGENYGAIVVNADVCTLYQFTLRNGSSIIAKQLELRGRFTLEEYSECKATVIKRDGGTAIAYIASVEKLVEVLAFDSDSTRLYIIGNADLTNADNVVNGDATLGENQVALKIYHEVIFENDATLNLGEKTLVLSHTRDNMINQYKVYGDGIICNGKIIYNDGTYGSPKTADDVIGVTYQDVEFENATNKEIIVTTALELKNALNKYNGRELNIKLTDSFTYDEDLLLQAPTTITIPKNITLTIGQYNYITLKYTEDGKYPKIIRDGTFNYSRKINIWQYEADYNANGFYADNSITAAYGDIYYYKIVDCEDFATLKTLAKSSTRIVIRVTKSFPMTESITLSANCKLWIPGRDASNNLITIEMRECCITCSYLDIDNYAAILGSTGTTTTGYLKYTQSADRIMAFPNKLVSDSVDISTLSSKIVAECNITATSSDAFDAAIRYSNISTNAHLTTYIYMRTFYTLSSSLTLRGDSKHVTQILLEGSYTFNLNGYTLALPYVNSSDFCKIYVRNGATLKNGFIKYNTDTPYELTAFVTVDSSSTTADLNYISF